MSIRRHTPNMKKTYETPVFYLEEFALSQAIAKNCGDTDNDKIYPTNSDYTVCGIAIDTNEGPSGLDSNDYFLFLPGSACSNFKVPNTNINIPGKPIKSPEDADGVYEEFCYHNPDGGIKLFGS